MRIIQRIVEWLRRLGALPDEDPEMGFRSFFEKTGRRERRRDEQ